MSVMDVAPVAVPIWAELSIVIVDIEDNVSMVSFAVSIVLVRGLMRDDEITPSFGCNRVFVVWVAPPFVLRLVPDCRV